MFIGSEVWAAVGSESTHQHSLCGVRAVCGRDILFVCREESIRGEPNPARTDLVMFKRRNRRPAGGGLVPAGGLDGPDLARVYLGGNARRYNRQFG